MNWKLKILGFIISILISSTLIGTAVANAREPAKESGKKSTKPQVYEQEDSSTSFSDHVKVVRDMASTAQVAFQKRKGFFQLEDSESGNKFRSLLVRAQQERKLVNVTVDSESNQILSVEIKE